MKLLTLAAILLCGSCTEPRAKQATVASDQAMAIEPRFENLDSLVVVFYKDPYGEDSLRYTRYYLQTVSTDVADVAIIKQQLQYSYKKEESVRPCRSEGKIWCFSAGKVRQTIYFNTNCDHCCNLYFIKDGFFYYSSSISNDLNDRLKLLRTEAKEPVAQ